MYEVPQQCRRGSVIEQKNLQKMFGLAGEMTGQEEREHGNCKERPTTEKSLFIRGAGSGVQEGQRDQVVKTSA